MPSFIKTSFNLELSISQAELIYIHLDLHKNPESLAEQRAIRLKLAKFYQRGSKEVTRNPWKAEKHFAAATNKPSPESNLWNQENFSRIILLYTLIRSVVHRLNRVLKLLGKAFLHRLFGIAGFSHFVTFFFDLYLITHTAYNAMPQETYADKQKLILKRILKRFVLFKQRFVNAIDQEEGRRNRMENDLMWGSQNLIFFLITCGWSTLVNGIGFVFDVCNVFEKRAYSLEMYQDLLRKFNHQIAIAHKQEIELNKKIKLLKTIKIQTLLDMLYENENIFIDILQDKVRDIDKEITDSFHTYNLITKSIHRLEYEADAVFWAFIKEKGERNNHLTMVSLVLIGVILYTLPGLNIVMIALGTGIVFGVSVYCLGSVLLKFGCQLEKFLNWKYHAVSHEKNNTSLKNLKCMSKHISVPTISGVPSTYEISAHLYKNSNSTQTELMNIAEKERDNFSLHQQHFFYPVDLGNIANKHYPTAEQAPSITTFSL